MVNLIIDGVKVEAYENENIMSAAKRYNIEIPHLCYLKDINEIGACRVCLVEVEGREKLLASCNAKVSEGMIVHTNTPRVREARRINVELILSQHNGDCTTCTRSGNCELQKLARELGIMEIPFPKKFPKQRWDMESPLIRDESKCIKCMRCVQVCEKIQGLGVWDIANTGSRTTVAVKDYLNLKDMDCTYCGQCVVNCPVGALYERDDTIEIERMAAKKDKIMIAQIAPAFKVAWGEEFGLDYDDSDRNKLVTALRKLGFDYVFDTEFSADVTIMEEANEFLHRFGERKAGDMPMFTSCCPAWISYMKSQFPEHVENLSSTKSPQQIFGALVKNYFPEVIGVKPEDIYSVSFMPCMAKKDEIGRLDMDTNEGIPDVDKVITTREFVRMLKRNYIDVESLEDGVYDSPMGERTGAATIFGVTGGVMEAALRTAYFKITGSNKEDAAFVDVRDNEGIKTAKFTINDIDVRVGIVAGLKNANRLIKKLKRKEIELDFVEVMACPQGCITGGGQPIGTMENFAKKRKENLYTIDERSKVRFSHENEEVAMLYDKFLEEPLSERAEDLLHCRYN